MLEPRVLLSAVPMLYALGNVNHVARLKRDGRLAPLLVPTLASHTNKYLACPVVNVPVVAAARFKGHVAHGQYGLFAMLNVLGVRAARWLLPVKY